MQVNVAGLRRNIKNLAHNYSDAQVKVREATSNDPWGPSATIMAEIAELTNNVVAFSEIMQMIWKRLNDNGKNWRHVYKALILLEYLIKTGNEKVSQQCKENIFAIQTLREFVYFEEGKDQGTHVREKAKQLVNLLKDDERLKNERIKALKAKERFAQYPSGFGSDGYIDGPVQRDMPPGWQEEPTKPVSELEMVRPQTAGEEELQLQLAMAMSREEAEQEEAKRRSDDVRLQLALSQSEQDFKHQKPPKEENQSHLMDLLDIQLGATSISSPPLGLAAGGLSHTTTEPWMTSARAASQMSDPWTGTASPPVDPWLPATNSRSTPLAHMGMGAVGGMGATMAMHSNGTNGGAEVWGSGMRTQSPSVTSGSSNEGWLQTNGNSQNALGMNVGGTVATSADAWSSKPNLPAGAAATISTVDAWLTDNNKPPILGNPVKTLVSEDPWAPKTGAIAADPWKSIESAATKPSPDMDEFDIITNRNKAASDLLNISNSPTHASNNNANLLEDLDPLSTTNTTISTGATAKKPLKDPQSFLGENSGLVNLDNLIKPAVPQNTSNAAAYNPFSDNVIPPKTNLFQQQQPAVPSINQLKQQSFQMTINQDPWAPVNNAATTAQLTPQSPDEIDLLVVDLNTPNKNLKSINKGNYNSNNNYNKTFNSYGGQYNSNTMKYSKSDYDGFRPLLNTQASYSDQFYNNSVDNLRKISLQQNEATSFLMDLDSDVFHTSNNLSSHLSYSSLYPHVEIINNNDTYASLKSPPTSPVKSQNHQSTLLNLASPLSPTQNDILSFDNNSIIRNPNNYNNNNNNNTINLNNSNNIYSPYNTSLGTSSSISNTSIEANPVQNFTSSSSSTITAVNFSNAFQASLAETPGVTIMPLNQQFQQQQQERFQEQQYHAPATNLFSYGFYDTKTNNSFPTDTIQCKLENNNNMPWIKPEAAASNPFLS